MGILRAIRGFLRMRGEERWLLVGALITVAWVKAALVTTPPRWLLRRVLGRTLRTPAGAAMEPILIGRAVRRAARLVPGATCLPQALATVWLMSGRGHPGDFRIGVKRGADGVLVAHAWVEHGNCIVVGDIGLKEFAVLPSLEGVLWLK